jgi:dTDP-4-dehydrorhamnose 3,5-epimerase
LISQVCFSIIWNDPVLAIAWPIDGLPMLAKKDAEGKAFRDAEVF